MVYFSLGFRHGYDQTATLSFLHLCGEEFMDISGPHPFQTNMPPNRIAILLDPAKVPLESLSPSCIGVGHLRPATKVAAIYQLRNLTSYVPIDPKGESPPEVFKLHRMCKNYLYLHAMIA